MHDDFSPEPEDRLPEQKNSQQLLLLLLLLLILLFVYLYFFTGLIKPRPQAPPKQNVASEGAVVKKPLPPRPSAGPETAAAEKTGAPAKEAKPGEPAAGKEGKAQPAAGKEAKVPAPGKEAKAGQPAQPAQGAKPAANAPEAKGGKAATADHKAGKPAPAEGKPGQAGVKMAKPAGAPAQAKGEKAPAAGAQAKGEKAPAAAEAKGGKPAAPGKQAKGAKTAQPKKGEKAEGAKAQAAQAGKGKLAVKPAAGGYALEINGELAESEIGPVVNKLKKAGVTQVVKTKSQKGEPMHRLFLADFGDKAEAQEELERLKLAAPSAFMLKESGRYAVYAGSYLRAAKATQEQERLYAKGVKLVLKTATAPISVVKLRAGSFADKASAERTADKLKKGGVQAKVVKVQK